MEPSEETLSLLEEQFMNLHLLSFEARRDILNQIQLDRPVRLKEYLPRVWYLSRCEINVLLVTDLGLDFGVGSTGLSEFIMAFNQLNATYYVKYKVTTAYRAGQNAQATRSANPIVVKHIDDFRFDRSVDLKDFDQVWIFGVDSGDFKASSAGKLSAGELSAIEKYMDSGGGLFATGDHGALGKILGGDIKRVKDMRYWDNTNTNNNLDEVSMTGKRRNDTNQPKVGAATSNDFENQSDDIPQRIAVRRFANRLPHPILSIPRSLRPSGVIDIMPDHPHEGECQAERNFEHKGKKIRTQILSTSFVIAGNTAIGKAPTEAHSFPGIAVWDGRPAGAGRIVVDSTWHHFINININGTGSPYTGLNKNDYKVIQRYFMNIARWMTRPRYFFCVRYHVVASLLLTSNLIEASLDDPSQGLRATDLKDLNSIGILAEEELSEIFGPAMARDFLLQLLEAAKPEFCQKMNVWMPEGANDEIKGEEGDEWLNYNRFFHVAIGAGFMSLYRDERIVANDDPTEEDKEALFEQFSEGASYGFELAVNNFRESINNSNRFLG